MERQFLRIFYILFFLVGCQQVEINKLETTAKEKNLNSFENTLFIKMMKIKVSGLISKIITTQTII